jgi:hypothetical protein
MLDISSNLRLWHFPLMCLRKLVTRVNLPLHTGQTNCGPLPHSKRTWTDRLPFCLYILPHWTQTNPGALRALEGIATVVTNVGSWKLMFPSLDVGNSTLLCTGNVSTWYSVDSPDPATGNNLLILRFHSMYDGRGSLSSETPAIQPTSTWCQHQKTWLASKWKECLNK